MKNMNLRRMMHLPGRTLAVAAAFVVAMVLSSNAHGQTPSLHDFNDCKPADPSAAPWILLCTPVWNLPIMSPATNVVTQTQVTYDAGTKLLEITGLPYVAYFAGITPAGFFNLTAGVSGGTSAIRVRVNSDGSLAGGAGNACGDGGPDDFCLTGTVIDNYGVQYGPGVLLRGRINHFVFKKRAVAEKTYFVCPLPTGCPLFEQYVDSGIEVPYDDFEFNATLLGGELFNSGKPSSISMMYGTDQLAIGFFGWNPRSTDPYGPEPYLGDNPFVASFTEVDGFGYIGPTMITAGLFCTATIGNRVWEDLNRNGVQDAGEPGLAGASVTLTGSNTASTMTTLSDGAYAFTNLCAGTYNVAASGPLSFTSSLTGAGTAATDSNASPSTVVVAADGSDSTVDFGFYGNPAIFGSYMTWGQGAWGAKPKSNNVAGVLAEWFITLYPTEDGLVIGAADPAFSITLTRASAIQDFLPQGGKPVPLPMSFVDPVGKLLPKHVKKALNHKKIGVLASSVLALQLNVDFSKRGLTRFGLQTLKVRAGLPLAGKKVEDVLNDANKALAGQGLPAGVSSYSVLNDLLEKINQNFDGGRDNGNLVP